MLANGAVLVHRIFLSEQNTARKPGLLKFFATIFAKTCKNHLMCDWAKGDIFVDIA
jgi:hypothetical protein